MAHSSEQPTRTELRLPSTLVGPIDAGRLAREIELVDDAFRQLQLRRSGEAVKLPNTTQLMDDFLKLNELNLLQEEDRVRIIDFLTRLRARAPQIHISFTTDPSPEFLGKLTSWTREKIHPYLLITIGLQPSIGAGCIVRTNNRYFDLSLKQSFESKRKVLISKLMPPNFREVAGVGGGEAKP